MTSERLLLRSTRDQQVPMTGPYPPDRDLRHESSEPRCMILGAPTRKPLLRQNPDQSGHPRRRRGQGPGTEVRQGIHGKSGTTTQGARRERVTWDLSVERGQTRGPKLYTSSSGPTPTNSVDGGRTRLTQVGRPLGPRTRDRTYSPLTPLT